MGDAPVRQLTTAEVARMLRTNRRTLWDWRRLGHGPPWVVVEGRVLYPAAELRAWLDSLPRAGGDFNS